MGIKDIASSLKGKVVDIVLSRDTQNTQTLNDMLYDKTKDLVKELSGANIVKGKKLIDNIIAVSNTSGGTGASTVALNLAHIVSNKGLSVLIIDANIMYPIQNRYLGVSVTRGKVDLVSYLYGDNILGDSIDTSHKINLLYSNNRSLMDNINCEAPLVVDNFNKAIKSLRTLYDLVIIDTPMTIEHALINNIFYIADQIYLVWDESIDSAINTEKIRNNMATSGIEAYTKMKVILNKRTSVNYSNYPFTKLNLELLEILPFDVSIIDSGLSASIYCEKGTSKSMSANLFYKKMESLADKVLINGGYIENREVK